MNAEASQAGFMSAGAPEIFREGLFSDGDVMFLAGAELRKPPPDLN